MKEKMLSFLKSIKITDCESFDMDFEVVSRNRFNHNQIDMIIVKDTPWEYPLLERFQQGLNTIDNYTYTLRFVYNKKPTSDDVVELFKGWYQSIYHLICFLNIAKKNEETVLITFTSEEEACGYDNVIIDFKEFLKFISYDFVSVETVLVEKKEEVVVDEKIKEQTKAAAEEIAQQDIADTNVIEEVSDRNDTLKQIEEEQKELNHLVEDRFLEEMRKNKELMDKERERARLNRRGKYDYIEKIDDITAESDHVDFNGRIYKVEEVARGTYVRLTLGIADQFGGAIVGWCYENSSINSELVSRLKDKPEVRVRGVAYVDDFSHTLQIKIHLIDIIVSDEIKKEDYEQNRVELHLHSTMSTQDGVSEMISYAQYAKALGHTAMAITDHGCVQGFPDAQKAEKKTGIKMLYGCEFYMIDDEIKFIYNPKETILNKATYVVFDLETTGLSARYNKIIEFGAVKISGGTEVDRLDILINPETHIDAKIARLTNIDDSMLEGKPKINEVLPKILEFIGDSILVTHNAQFDCSFLNEALVSNGYEPLKNGVVDTLALSRYLFPESKTHRLGALCNHLEVVYDEESAHRADYDAFVLGEVWHVLLGKLTVKNLSLKHSELAKLEIDKKLLPHLRAMHVVALAKNKEGLRDLYKLVSISNIEYVSATPIVPRRVLNEYRTNLLLGSACLNGEVFETSRYYNHERLVNTCKFYDYIEVQPPENYSILVNMDELSEDEVKRNICDIISAAKEAGKMVCATGDVHYLSPREKIFRDIYISAPQVGKMNHPLNPYARSKMPHFENPDQHYRSTKEMLDAFSFLDEDLAKEIVITNTNKVADMIEPLKPVPNDKLYTPKIDNSENILREMCYTNAKKLYGDPLPEFIQTRLDTELNGIISNGYSVIYYIAHKLVKMSNEDGYIVGSRGSVGSSFAATMAGITEVNPLPPHYICPKCHHLEWGKDEYPDIKSGFDLPNKKCPCCGEELIRDGQDIPFETFLGFHAEKVPDIDLNFPRDYQARAHEHTKTLLGADKVFRAGTIETVAEKTAFGFARGYLERMGIDPNTYPKAKIEYLASGCVGVKRTTGQHPGGIVVIPKDHEVYDFTPIQWPADEIDSSWKTTHFDFHSIHDTILKLDMLGHLDPMALKMMCDLAGKNIDEIPMNDPEVLKLFSSSEPLKLESNYLHQETGAMAIPEFGTDFVRGILEKTHPTTFADLVIISGLSHGTDVWNGNAETLINNKTATLREVIGCRDDIMTYLIGKGIPSSISFAIMEDVRHGNGLKQEYVEVMTAHNVPQYYIDSCNKIQYLFPKGHAVAYVTMAIRVGYFKVYYPLEFYATFFSVRSKQFDIIPMIKGYESIVDRLEQLRTQEKRGGAKLSPKEEEQYKTLQIALEMVERGYKFGNISLYKSDAVNFVIDHENKMLIPPFITIDGLGENNAITVVEERKNKPFSSKEDLLKRTKLTSTNVKDLSDLGVLDELNENDQLSLFDF